VTAKQVGNLASAISAKTGIDDETIQSGQNMLLTFKNLRNETGKGNDIFDQTTKTLVDMSSAMGTEPKQAAIQLGKALNDPVKGVSALSRVGVTFTDQQKEQIKTLVAGGKTMDAQKIVLRELNSEFGGAAEAQATAGDKMGVAFGNLKEQIGTALLPVIDKFATFATEKVIPAVSKFIKQIQNGKGAGGQFVDALKAIKGGLEDAWNVLKPVIDFIANNKTVVATFAGVLLTVAAGVKVWAAAQAILNVALTANPIGIVVVAIAALAAGLVYAWKKSETFRNAVKTLAIGFIELGRFGVMAFRLLLTAAFNTFDGILSAAEKGLGWIPGIGPKISAARAAFQSFGDATIGKLQGVEDKLRGVQNEIAGIPASKTFTLNMVTVKSTQTKNSLGEFGGPRAMGGPVSSSKFYLVGENGPELFAPRTSGAIVPNGGGSAIEGAAAGPRTVRLVVRDREFEAYMDERADGRIDANGRHPIGRRR
jgi:phage-related protein